MSANAPNLGAVVNRVPDRDGGYLTTHSAIFSAPTINPTNISDDSSATITASMYRTTDGSLFV